MRWHEVSQKPDDNQMGLCKLFGPFDYLSISMLNIYEHRERCIYATTRIYLERERDINIHKYIYMYMYIHIYIYILIYKYTYIHIYIYRLSAISYRFLAISY